MKRLFLLILVFLFAMGSCSSMAEEERSTLPFGISPDATIEDVVEAMTPVLGEPQTMVGFDGLWAFEPENCYLYDFLVERASAISRETGWEIIIDLDEGNQELLIDHLTALYAALHEWYGEPAETSPEYATYDLMGNKAVRVLYDDQEALQAHLDKYKFENGWYTCSWQNCAYHLSIFHYTTSSGSKTGFSVELRWEKKDAKTEETAPETAQ